VKKKTRALIPLLFAGLSVLIVDQVTKELVVRWLGFGREVEVIPGFFTFVCNSNTGAAFGLLTGKQIWLAFVSIAAAVIIPFFIKRSLSSAGRPTLQSYGLTILLAGNLGNLVDRLIRPDGVVDFLYLHIGRRTGTEIGWFPFNVADAAICIGVGLYIFGSYRAQRKKETDASTG